MMDSTLIDKYILNLASEQERQQVERALSKNPEVANQIQLRKDLIRVLEEQEDDSLKEHLQSLTLEKSTYKVARKTNIPWLAAAVVAALITLTLFIGNPFESKNDALFAQHFEPYPNTVKPLVRGEQSEDALIIAFIHYEAKEYEQAIAQFELLKQESDDPAINFYLGVSLLAIKDYEAAIGQFELLKNASEEYAQKANWYLALAFLKTDQAQKAKNVLNDIVANKEFEYAKAKNILSQLE